jgi:Adenylate and Guanylate cyclase catalytic domain
MLTIAGLILNQELDLKLIVWAQQARRAPSQSNFQPSAPNVAPIAPSSSTGSLEPGAEVSSVLVDDTNFARKIPLFLASPADVQGALMARTVATSFGLFLGRLLKAIAALGVAETAPASASRRLREDAVPHGGERRQLTVMFCDLVGSTALSEKLDPEELRNRLHSYRILCGDVIARYDGFVARYVGDGILTYFGWPTAHEEDAERAVRASSRLRRNKRGAWSRRRTGDSGRSQRHSCPMGQRRKRASPTCRKQLSRGPSLSRGARRKCPALRALSRYLTT